MSRKTPPKVAVMTPTRTAGKTGIFISNAIPTPDAPLTSVPARPRETRRSGKVAARLGHADARAERARSVAKLEVFLKKVKARRVHAASGSVA